MQIEIDIDDETLRRAVTNAAKKAIDPSQWDRGQFSGYLVDHLHKTIDEQMRNAISNIDMTALIESVVAEKLLPTVKDMIGAELKTIARREVKAAMEAKTA